MFPQISAFFSGIKSSITRKGGGYRSRRRVGDDDDDDDDDDDNRRSLYGCLGRRSVSMEWGGLSSRKRRTATSTESLERMSDHFRSAISLMELTQATQARPFGGGGDPSSSPAVKVPDTCRGSSVSSSSSSHVSSHRSKNRATQSQPNGAPSGSDVALFSRGAPRHQRSSSSNSRHSNRQHHNNHHHSNNADNRNHDNTDSVASSAAAKRVRDPFAPVRRTPSDNRANGACPTSQPPPPPPSSVARPRSRRKDVHDLPPPVSKTTPRRIGTDAVDSATAPSTVETPTGSLNRPPSSTTPNGKILKRNIQPLNIIGNGIRPSDVIRPEAENIYNKPETVVQSMMECVVDNKTGSLYSKGKLLGKGGFARCFELIDIRANKSYAGKIISRSRLTRENQKEKITREVELHKGLQHRNVVRFHSYFEDDLNVFIVLEYCSRKSLVHVLKNRKTLTEPEVRYHMHSLVNGLSYIHGQHIIHRDLKLGNMLLNESMDLKIADFGLATRVEFEGEKKMTVCGTPNYIAPEVLQKRGHSYEADIWALGCIMYALLCGRPPFETTTLKETYMRIVTNKFILPPHVSMTARNLICKFLTLEPSKRPLLSTIPFDSFFSDGHFPTSLSTSTCDSRPKYPMPNILPRKPKTTNRNNSIGDENCDPSNLAHTKGSKKSASQIITRMKTPDAECMDAKSPDCYPQEVGSAPSFPRNDLSAETTAPVPSDAAVRLHRLLIQSLEAINNPNQVQQPESTLAGQVNRLKTTICVTKWVDYSNKYGFGFQLSNNCVGILFNDGARMLLTPDGTTIQMSDPAGSEPMTFTPETAPEEHQKKVTLLLYFAQYMDTHLIPGGQLLTKNKQVPVFMKKWFRTDRAIVMFLMDGTLQVNFLEDHTKVILNPDGQDFLLTLVNSTRQAATYPLKILRHLGCSPEVLDRLRYACAMLERIIETEKSSG